MSDDRKIHEALSLLGDRLKQHSSVKEQVMQRILSGEMSKVIMLPWYRTRRGQAIASLAACLALAAGVWHFLGGVGAQEAFASAVSSLQNAHTFYSRCTHTATRADGQTIVSVMTHAFQEPNLERFENNSGVELAPEIHIRDYGRKIGLMLHPSKNEAALEDLSSSYAVDEATGQLRPSRLSTDLREELLEVSSQAAKDLGHADLNGLRVRVLQGQKGKCVTTIWLDETRGLPVQVRFERPGSNWVYSDIQINTALDPALFSTEVPAGYTLFRNGMYKPAPDYYAKIMIKMMFLGRHVYLYANTHNNQFPERLEDMIGNDLTEQTLKTVMSAPDQPDGLPVIQYRQPRPNVKTETEIMLYEVPEQRRDGKVAVGMADGHAEVLTQDKFDELMR